MIRLNKPVKLLEWGAGTNTLNQRWDEIAEGSILSANRRAGVTLMVVQVKGVIEKQNRKDDSIKVVQQGEGLTARSQMWGEVAMGKLKAIESAGGRSIVQIEIQSATKIGKALPGL